MDARNYHSQNYTHLFLAPLCVVFSIYGELTWEREAAVGGALIKTYNCIQFCLPATWIHAPYRESLHRLIAFFQEHIVDFRIGRIISHVSFTTVSPPQLLSAATDHRVQFERNAVNLDFITVKKFAVVCQHIGKDHLLISEDTIWQIGVHFSCGFFYKKDC